MLNLLRSELFRLRKRPQSWMLLVIAFVLTAFVYGGFVIGARVTTGQERTDLQESLTFPELSDFGLAFGLAFFGSVMLVIVAAGMMGNEYSWNTLRPLTARARSRVSLLTAKLLTALIYSVLFCVVLAVLIGGLSIVSSAIAGIDSGFSMDAAREALEYTFKLVFANVPYMAFAFMLSTIARSNAAGIAGALGLSFIEQPILQLLGLASDAFERIEEFGLSYNLNAILGFGDGDGTRGAIILAFYTAIFVAVSYVVFLRRDVTSG
jgi:ABC-type transport system involved in multi-copper enzyme maturation permease subunit